MATIVEGDTKAPFSIATTLRCRGGCYYQMKYSVIHRTVYIYIYIYSFLKLDRIRLIHAECKCIASVLLQKFIAYGFTIEMYRKRFHLKDFI